MKTNPDTTIIAFLLAFQDLNTALSTQEKQILQELAKQLDTQPKAWDIYIKKRLLELVSANSELNESYKFYQSQLENLAEIPHNLLPNEAEISGLNSANKVLETKGFKPKSEATDYASQLNNVVVIVGTSEEPEATVKQVTFLEKLKEYLSDSSSSN